MYISYLQVQIHYIHRYKITRSQDHNNKSSQDQTTTTTTKIRTTTQVIQKKRKEEQKQKKNERNHKEIFFKIFNLIQSSKKKTHIQVDFNVVLYFQISKYI